MSEQQPNPQPNPEEEAATELEREARLQSIDNDELKKLLRQQIELQKQLIRLQIQLIKQNQTSELEKLLFITDAIGIGLFIAFPAIVIPILGQTQPLVAIIVAFVGAFIGLLLVLVPRIVDRE